MVILQLEEQPPLIQAIFSGEVDAVRKLLESKQDVNYQDFEKRSALQAAAFRGDAAITKLLIEHGARVNTKDCKWVTPLHRACYSGSEETVTILFNNAADTCARDRLWQTPLHVAAACNSLECVSYLLERIQNPNVTDRSGRTALHHAVLNGHNEIVKLLISKGSIVNACDRKDSRPIHWAAYKGHADTVDILLRHGADINAKDRTQYTPLHVAAASGVLSAVETLIENGADVEARNAYGNTPLHVACLNGHVNMSAELIDYKANTEALNYRGQTPLHLAAASTHGAHCLNLLLRYDVDINKQSADGRTPLHMTAIHGRFTRSKTLIDKGAIVDCVDKNGCTALHVAAQYGHELLSNTLLSYGADPNRKGFAGRTPLHMCCLAGYVECCRVFIKAGVDLNERDDSGKTPLHCAAYKGAVECVDLLVSSGADFRVVDNVGRTALHYAAVQGFFFCVFTLVGVGSAVNKADADGCAPLHLAAAYDVDGRCVNYLIEHKADPKLRDAKGFTAIHYAAAGNNVNALKYLLYAVGNSYAFYGPDMPPTTPMHIAARNGNAEILEKLMSCMSDPNIRNEHGCTPLLLAARQGYANCVQMLLRFGAKVSVCDHTGGMSPVHHSAKNGHVHCLALLVDNAEDKAVIDRPDDLRRTPLMLAVSNSHAESVTTLIKSGADANIVDGDGHSCLFRAVVIGQHHILQMLLPRSTVVNERDVHGKTILHVAAACGRLACVQRILPYMTGAEARESRDEQDCTALHWACYSGSADCVTAFFDEGIFHKMERGNSFSPVHCAASVGSERCLELVCARYGPGIVNLKDHRCRTALHVAALLGNGDCVKFLLEQGADVDCRDEDGKTPLVSAAFNGRAQVIGILVSNKANLTLQDKRGNTALHAACLRKHTTSAMLLLEFINSVEIINMANNERKTALHVTARNGLVEVTRQLIAKGASVTAVDAEGFTPALCCAPNANVAQCLAVILAHHSTQTRSSNGKDDDSSPPSRIPGLNYIKTDATTSTSTLRHGHSRNLQTDITLLRDPDQFELERMFEIEFRKTPTPTSSDPDDNEEYRENIAPIIGQPDNDGSRFFIRYDSSDVELSRESTSPTSSTTVCAGSVFELHGSQSDTVLAPKPIYSEEDYEKIIRRPANVNGENRTAVDGSSRGAACSKSTRRKSRLNEELRLPSRQDNRRTDTNLKSKSVASVLNSYPSRSYVEADREYNKRFQRVHGVGATPKANRFPKSTNKRLKQPSKADTTEVEADVDGAGQCCTRSDRCLVCKKLLGSSEHDDEHNIPLEAMQTAIERVLSRKDCATNRCLLAFLDESYELNAKNAHLIYHGMLSPRCEPYIAKHLDLANEREVEIVGSVAEEGTYVVNRKPTKSSSPSLKTTVRTAADRALARNKLDSSASRQQHIRAAGTDKQGKWLGCCKQQTASHGSNNSKGDSKLKITRIATMTTAAAGLTNVHSKKTKDCYCYRRPWLTDAQKNSTRFGQHSIAGKTDPPSQVQKVQSERGTNSPTKSPRKSKNLSVADVGAISRDDSDERAKLETSCGEIPIPKQETETKEPQTNDALCDYLRPLTDFQHTGTSAKVAGEEEEGVPSRSRVRCYSTYWCFSEPTNEVERKEEGAPNRNATQSDSRLDRTRPFPTGDCVGVATTSVVKSESGLKKVAAAREEQQQHSPPRQATPTSAHEEIIFFNDKLLSDGSRSDPRQNSALFFTDDDEEEEEEGNEEEIEELERLRRLDERPSKDGRREEEDEREERDEETEGTTTTTTTEVCSLERRAGVTNIKTSSADAVHDWCEDLQQFFTRSRRRQLAEDAERLTGTERINVDDWRLFAAKNLNGPTSKSDQAENIERIEGDDDVGREEERADGDDDADDRICVLHYDNRVSATISSEYCVENDLLQNRIVDVEVATDANIVDSLGGGHCRDSPEIVSIFGDIPTVDADEHLVKSTILNEDSETFLDGIQRRQEQQSEEERQQQQQETSHISSNSSRNGRILIRKTDDDPVEDDFIKKKPTRTGDSNRRRWKDEKAINWKLYMAHRCLQLSDHMNVDDHGAKSSSRSPPSSATATVGKMSRNTTAHSPTQSTCREGDFRRKRSTAEGEDNLRDSYRYTGLRFEEYEGTVNIDDVIANENDERPSNNNGATAERLCVLKDQETTTTVCVGEASSSFHNVAHRPASFQETTIDRQEQHIVEEHHNDTIAAAAAAATATAIERPKSFLERVDIKDLIGADNSPDDVAHLMHTPTSQKEDVDDGDKTVETNERDDQALPDVVFSIWTEEGVQLDLLEMYDFDSTDAYGGGEAADSFETKMEDEGFSETIINLPGQAVNDDDDDDAAKTSTTEKLGVVEGIDSSSSNGAQDGGFSHVKVDEITGENGEGDEEEKKPAADLSLSSGGNWEHEIKKVSMVVVEEDAEPRSEEQTTASLDKSDEYHDADLPIDVDNKDDEEETTETVFYDTESESSVAEDELPLSPPAEEATVTVASEPNSTTAGKKNASQKSVHFQIGVVKNDSSEPKTTTTTDEDENSASVDTIYHVNNENPGAVAVFLESDSDVSCLRRTLLEGQPNEKIPLIEGVAPSDTNIDPNDEENDNNVTTKKDGEVAAQQHGEKEEDPSLESSECDVDITHSKTERAMDATVMRVEQNNIFYMNRGTCNGDAEKTGAHEGEQGAICADIETEKREYEGEVGGIKLTQQYVVDAARNANDTDLERDVGDTVDDPIPGIDKDSFTRTKEDDVTRPDNTTGEVKNTVKTISRNVKPEDGEECLLLTRAGNKKTFPSASKLGKKAKKDSNCKIS